MDKSNFPIQRNKLQFHWPSLLCLGILFCSPVGYTQTASDLYQAQVTVKQRGEEARQEGFRQALTQVLIKLSGDRQTPLQPAIQKELKDAQRWVDEYRYLTEPQEPQQVLSVHFAEELTDDLLDTLKLPIWSSTRPGLLTWIVLDTKDQQQIINEEDASKEVTFLKEQAQQRGLPILFPILDVDDLATLKIADVMNGNRDPVMKIAKRYGVKTILVGWLLKTLDGWQSQWHLYINAEEIPFHATHPQLREALQEGFQQAVDHLAKRFIKLMPINTLPSPEAGPAVEFDVIVTNVPTLRDYAKVNDYLEHLDIVEEVQVLRIQPGDVKFHLTVRGGKSALRQAISFGNLLVPQSDNGEETGYRLVNGE